MQTQAKGKTGKIPQWIKILTTCFLWVFVAVYWTHIGPSNFLWFSDIALITITVALWLESRFLASMMAVNVLLPELAWNIDFFFRLLTGSHLFGLGATSYMFNPHLAISVRIISLLFHLYLPVLLILALHWLGYHGKAWIAQTVLAWIVLPLCYRLTDPAANINWVFGLGAEPQRWLPGPLYVVFLMILLPMVIYIPSHLLLKKMFGKKPCPEHT